MTKIEIRPGPLGVEGGEPFLDKVGVWSYADACIEDIAEVLTAQI